VAAVLGVSISGAAYLPLDARWPAERLAQLLHETDATVVLTQSRVLSRWQPPPGVRTFCVDEEREGSGPLPEATGEPAQPDDLAYVIYTSGSTGRPKGVMITHRAALNTIEDINERFAVTASDRVLGLSSMSFDLSVYDVFGTLSAGGMLVLPTVEGERDPAQWWSLIAGCGVTIWNSVPALMELLVDYGRRVGARGAGPGVGSLRLAMLSGDWIGLTLPEGIRGLAPECAVVSLGGATEAAIWSVLYPIGEVSAEWTSIPYGRAMRNQRLYVLNEAWQPCPVWARGSLYIAGEGLALGYWRDEVRTASSFVTHPQTGERLYRTGDLARYRPDGTLELLGREDLQIKLHGHRIEPGEIEAVLLQHPSVSQAAVVAQDTVRGDRQLTAFVVLGVAEAADAPRATPEVPDADYLKKLEIRTRQPNIRRDVGAGQGTVVALARPDDGADAFLRRRSRRRYLQTPIDQRELGLMLSAIAQLRHPSLMFPKYRYGSAGNLYPIQTYLYVKPGRILGVAGGFHYYNPRHHDLRALADAPPPSVDDIGAQNAALFDDCGFVVFLVASMAAMNELYGEAGARYAAIEAGLITQLLETIAPEHGIGVCQIGGVSFADMRDRLAVDEHHLLVHTLLAGKVDPAEDPVQGAVADARAFGRPRTAVAAADTSAAATFESIKAMLKSKLPAPLVPAAFVEMDALPLNDNGKVDRGALRDLQPAGASAARAATAAATVPALSATVLAELCAQVLGRDRIGTQENFLESGGNSMLAIKLISRVQNLFGLAVPLADFFEDATPAGLAALVDKLRQGNRHTAEAWESVTPDPANRHAPFPLSAVQQAYWVGRRDAVHLGSVSTHAYIEIDIDDLDLSRFERAMRLLIERHGMLRAVFSSDGYQRILERVPDYVLEHRDLRSVDPQQADRLLVETRERMSHQVLPADRWPLFELFAHRLPQGFRLHLSIDLLLADAYSLQLLHRDFLGYYAHGERYAPRAVEFTFRDYILAARRLRESARYARARSYWMERLPHLPPPPELPLRGRVGNAAHRFQRLSARIERNRWGELRRSAARNELTASGLLCAAFARVLALWTGSAHFTLGMTTFGRLGLHPDIDEIVGDFTMMIPLEVDVGAPAFEAAAQAVQRQLWRDMDNALFDGIEVQRERNRLQRHIGAAAFPVVFTSTIDVGTDAGEGAGMDAAAAATGANGSVAAAPALNGRISHSISQTSQVLLDHQISEVNGALSYTWDYDAALLPQDLMEAMFSTYARLLEDLSVDEEAWHA
jgi:amino acid adenylation domain-containing protein